MRNLSNNSSPVANVLKYQFVDSFPKKSERNWLITACCFTVSNSLAVVKGLQFPTERFPRRNCPRARERERGGTIFLYVREISIVIIRQPARESSAESGGSSRWSSSPLIRPTWPRSSPSREWSRRSRTRPISQNKHRSPTELSKAEARWHFSE